MALHVTELTSVGVVSEGDNPGAEIMFYKKRKDVNAVSVESMNGDEMSLDITALPDEAQEHISELAKAAEDAATQITALEAQIAALTPTADVVEVEVGKASDEVQTLIAKQREQLDEQAEALQVEVAKRRDTEFIAKVRSDNLEGLLGNADEVGPVLRTIADASPDAFEKLYAPILAAVQRVKLAKAFEELGSNDGDTDPIARQTAWVSKQKQDGTDRTDSQLRVDFWAAHPDAVAAERDK